MLATWRIGPALAAGNTVVVKPPEWAPLTASLLADIMHEAGLPAGVFNVVQGTGAAAGAPLTAHPGINRLAFTGSVPTAGVIAKAAAENIVPLSYELGGKSPLVVLDDADLDLAVEIAVEQFDNAGQVCLKAARMLVHSSLVEEFTARVVAGAEKLVQGDPRDEATDVSALISRRHFDQISGFVQRALDDGARALLGGGPNDDLGGLYFRPTILVDAPEDSEIMTEEVFGPVVTIQSFETEGRRSARPTTAVSAWPPPSSPAARTPPSASPRSSTPAPCGSTASSSVTWRRPSAATASPASAARAGCGPSTSTPTSRTASSAPPAGRSE
jgi:5-carboxymethyl-2-hydroxymuconic-semialdehyde dehydrogenase